MDKVTMAAFCSAKAQGHRSSFQHAHIQLYPGEIDSSGELRSVTEPVRFLPDHPS